ncbi:hypothetical protein ACRALDRAFT_2113249 [Sodiomyces alcalophilus JCM 7366]|uniref:uncharacterized protein n=1 Tax=Sodiomyces alcalophilus JCM 7366 TaxID=591952 RepID=UPI0039B57882
MESAPSDRDSNISSIRLSWPIAGDNRRSVVGRSPESNGDREGDSCDARFVHVSHCDMEAHYQFAKSKRRAGPGQQPILQIPLAWNSLKLEVGAKELLEHFQYAASQSLAIFGHEPTVLGDVLCRIALTGNTASSRAALQSLLALSALHRRHDVHSQAVELKIAALKSLAAGMGNQIGTREAIQHVAAGMLLCSFEIHRASCTSSDWMQYLRGAKDIIRAAGLDKIDQDADLAILLDWVYYHDVLSRFTLGHWHRESAAIASKPSNIRAEPSRTAPPALTMIELLSEICDAISAGPPPRASTKDMDDHKEFLKILDWRIRSLGLAGMANNSPQTLLMLELYQLAMLVYLNRASGDLLNQSARTKQQIEKAFLMFPLLESCDRQFPVFVLGCEAKTDEQRAVVLDLISRTEPRNSSRSFNYVRLLTQAIWAQDDLADGDLDYSDKISRVISRCSILPTFV